MTEYNINQTTTTDLDNKISGYSVDNYALDFASGQGETTHDFDKATEYFGYYKKIPELKQSIDALARWTTGKGWTVELDRHRVIIDKIRGWGEDTIDSIFWNMQVVKKVVGDSFAEIIKNDKGTIINLKPISPERMRIVTNNQGRIIRYEEKITDGNNKKFKPKDILHLSNDRLADEIHGTSIVGSVKWVIDARNEALETYKKIMKRALSLGVLYIDSDDEAKLNRIKSQYKEAVANGEVLILPMDTAEIKDAKVTVQDFITWIRYLENFFYQAVGVPKIIMGGSADYTEASSKVGYLTFEQVYMAEQRQLEQDIEAQLGIKIRFERPVSLKDNVQGDEAANTGQTTIQPKEAGANLQRE